MYEMANFFNISTASYNVNPFMRTARVTSSSYNSSIFDNKRNHSSQITSNSELQRQIADIRRECQTLKAGLTTQTQPQNFATRTITVEPINSTTELQRQIANLRKECEQIRAELLGFATSTSSTISTSSTTVETKNTEVKTQKSVPASTSTTKSSYGRQVKVSELSSVYNQELSEKLAKQSLKESAGRTKSTGWCAKAVNDALEKAGLADKNSTRCASAYMLERVFDNNSSFKRVNVSRDELKNLPAGCIVVWQNGYGFGTDFAKHGHVVITQGNGKATSDYVQNMKDYGTEFAVFVPVK
ncbi:hypothetical protein IJ732_03775 [bacterium]|nr:hypothetical protein [bacterium]